jgi:hypothetical protein
MNKALILLTLILTIFKITKNNKILLKNKNSEILIVKNLDETYQTNIQKEMVKFFKINYFNKIVGNIRL